VPSKHVNANFGALRNEGVRKVDVHWTVHLSHISLALSCVRPPPPLEFKRLNRLLSHHMPILILSSGQRKAEILDMMLESASTSTN
jgi:hypothetical protein